MLCTIGWFPKITDVLNLLTCSIGRYIIPLLFALAVAGLVFGIVQFFIIGADEEAKREQGKQFIIWGIIALAVMLSVWGLVRILGGTLGLNTRVLPGVRPPGTLNSGGDEVDTPIDVPCFPRVPGDCPPNPGNS